MEQLIKYFSLLLLLGSLYGCSDKGSVVSGSSSDTPRDVPYTMATRVTEYFINMTDELGNAVYFSNAEIRKQAFSPDGKTLISIVAGVIVPPATEQGFRIYKSSVDDNFQNMEELMSVDATVKGGSGVTDIAFNTSGTEFYVLAFIDSIDIGQEGTTGERVLLRFSGEDFKDIDTVHLFGEGNTDYFQLGKLLFKTIGGQERIYLFSPYADGVTNGKVIVLDPNSETVPGKLDVIETHKAMETISRDVADFEVSNDGKWIFYLADDFDKGNSFKVWKQSASDPSIRTILDLNFSNDTAHVIKPRRLFMSPNNKLIAYGRGSIMGKDLFSALKMYSGADFSKKTYIEGFTQTESMDGAYGNPYFIPGENPFIDLDNWNFKGYGIGDIVFSPSGDKMYAVGSYSIGRGDNVVAKVYYDKNYSKGVNIDIYDGIWAWSRSIAYNPAENYLRVSGSYSEFNWNWDEILGESLTRYAIGFSTNIILERPVSK